MRLATVMMSLRLAGALTFAPEPIVMATSFSVRVWQICAWKSKTVLMLTLGNERGHFLISDAIVMNISLWMLPLMKLTIRM